MQDDPTRCITTTICVQQLHVNMCSAFHLFPQSESAVDWKCCKRQSLHADIRVHLPVQMYACTCEICFYYNNLVNLFDATAHNKQKATSVCLLFTPT